MILFRLTLICIISFFSAITVTAQTTQPLPKTVLWRISGKGMKQSSYLFGTMHLRDKRIFNFSDSLYAAIEKTDGFAIEIDPDEMAAELIKSFSTKDTSGYIKDELNKESYERIRKKLEKKYGAKLNRLTRRQAFLSRNEWLEDMAKPDDMSSFMDAYLYHIARQQGKWVGGIEDLEDQMSIINKEEKDFSIEDILFDLTAAKNMLNEMVQMYSNNDLQKMYELFVKMEDAKKNLLLNKRNIKMCKRIDSLMRLRTSVFAVGVAHLPGDSGVITLLRAGGYQVEPVFSTKKVEPGEYKFKPSKNYWQQYIPSDSVYSIRYPSSSSTIYAAENLVKMEMCMDIPTSTFYISAGIPNYTKMAVTDNRLEELLIGFSRKGKVTSKTKLEHNGIKGVEIIVEGESFYRARAYLSENYAFMVVMGHDSKKQALTDADADYFFNSFKAEPKAFKKQRDWYLHTDSSLAFSVLLPSKPIEPKVEISDEWITSNLSSFDGIHQVYFIVISRSSASGYYINGDSNYFNLLKQSWADAGYKKMKDEPFYMGENAALKYDLLQKQGKDTYYTRTMSVNRGNRSYLLLATTTAGNEKNEVIDRFFNSFRLTTYQSASWSFRSAPDNLFSAYVPRDIRKQNLNKDEAKPEKENYIYRSYDTSTAVTYELQPVSFTTYYQAVSDSAVFRDALNALKEYSDSVLEIKTTTNGVYKAQDVVLGIEGSSLLRRLRLIWKGDTVYAAYSFLQPSLLHHPDVDRYFNELQLNGPAVITTLYQKKTKLLFEDLWSGDSARFEKAARQIDQVEFDKEDIPFLKQSLLRQYDFAEDVYPNVYNDIADAIYGLKDSTILTYVDKVYFSLKVDNEGQRVAMLRLLALTKTKESYLLLKNLLLTEPPATSYTYAYHNYMQDSLALTALLFPEMLRLVSDSNYCYLTTMLATELLDSNFITLQTIKAYEKELQSIAAFAYNKFREPEPDSWFYSNALHLLAKLNTKQGNEQLLKIAALNIGVLNRSLVPEMLLHKVTIPANIIERTAAEKSYRYGLYRQLEQRNLQSFFPAKYSSQKMIAESDVYLMASEDEEYEVSDVVYLQTKKREVNGVQKVFYLFKVKIDEEWYLGISGGYSTDSKRIIQEKTDDTGGIYWSEVYNSKKVDALFEAFFNQ